MPGASALGAERRGAARRRRTRQDAPVGHHGRAHALVEADRVLVPVEHAPFEAAAAALDGEPRQPLEQRLADALAALGRLDEQVLEIEARAGRGRSRSW